jgi:hypothetical protein
VIGPRGPRSCCLLRSIVNICSCTAQFHDIMAPSFLKELRRRSRASFRTAGSTDSSTRSNETVPTTKSSSTLNSTYGSQTPPSDLHNPSPSSTSQVQALLPPPAASQQPQLASSPSVKRFSVSGMSGSGSQGTANSAFPVSPFSPRITSINDGAWVCKPCSQIRLKRQLINM